MSDVTFDFTGKSFAVVGATSGIGAQVFSELMDAHAAVLAVGRNRISLENIQNSGGWRAPSTFPRHRQMIGKIF